MSDTTGSPFTTERELAEDQHQENPTGSPADKPGPPNPPVDEDAVDRGLEQLDRVKPY